MKQLPATESTDGQRQAVVYARVSSKEQEKEGYSIPAQLDLLRSYAAREGFSVTHEYVDIETAKHTGRTNFSKMVDFLKEDIACRTLLVEKTDRLYRNLKDWLTMDELDLEIHFAKEGVVLSRDSRSTDKFMHGIKVLMAKNYIDNLSEEVKKGMKEKVRQGGFPHLAPVGYVNNKQAHTIEVDEEKAPFVIKLFELYATGDYSLAALRKKCIELDFTTRPSEKRISKSKIESILKNPFYTGVFKWNGEMYQGTHTPIISQQLFGVVQDAFASHNKPERRRKRDFAFAGLLKCGRCGCSITAEMKKEKYVYYHCTHAKGQCEESSIREEKLAEVLGDAVRGIQIDNKTLEWIKEALRESHKDEREFHDKAVSNLQVQYKKLQGRIDRSYDDKVDGKISEDFWREKTGSWKDKQEKLLVRIKAHKGADTAYLEEGVQILELANRAYSLYLTQSAKEKARLLRAILSNCTLENGTPRFTYRKPFDILAEGVKTENWLGREDSNPHRQIQRLQSYPWTTPQRGDDRVMIIPVRSFFNGF